MSKLNLNLDPNHPLTPRQTRFAAAVASGVTKKEAHRQNYKTNPGFEKNDQKQALMLAKRPHVAAEIRRLVWLSCPPADDIRGMREHSIRVLSDLSRTGKSEEVRLKAALALFKIAETTRAAAAPAASTKEQDRLLDRLRELYRTVQGVASRDQPRKPGAPPAPPPFFGEGVEDPLPDLPVAATGDDEEAIDIRDFTVNAEEGEAEEVHASVGDDGE
jgi:hypothetical protein